MASNNNKLLLENIDRAHLAKDSCALFLAILVTCCRQPTSLKRRESIRCATVPHLTTHRLTYSAIIADAPTCLRYIMLRQSPIMRSRSLIVNVPYLRCLSLSSSSAASEEPEEDVKKKTIIWYYRATVVLTTTNGFGAYMAHFARTWLTSSKRLPIQVTTIILTPGPHRLRQ
jgi:hypothetical protein